MYDSEEEQLRDYERLATVVTPNKDEEMGETGSGFT